MSDLISRAAAIGALKAMAVPRYKDPACEDMWERDRTLDNAIGVMRELPSAQPEKQWIPCSERLPFDVGYYLTSTIYNEVFCDYWNMNEWNRTEQVIAWMTLPDPYWEDKK